MDFRQVANLLTQNKCFLLSERAHVSYTLQYLGTLIPRYIDYYSVRILGNSPDLELLYYNNSIF